MSVLITSKLRSMGENEQAGQRMRCPAATPLRFLRPGRSALMSILPPGTDQDSEAHRDVPTSVYRYYDNHKLLLYVGITSRGVARNSEHNKSKGWWQYVTSQTVKHFPSRGTALLEESRLIQKYRPPFNTQQNPGYLTTRAAYLTWRQQLESSTALEHPPTTRLPKTIRFVPLFGSRERMVLRSQSELPPKWNMAPVGKIRARRLLTKGGCGRIESARRDGPFATITLSQTATGIRFADAHVKWRLQPMAFTILSLAVVLDCDDVTIREMTG